MRSKLIGLCVCALLFLSAAACSRSPQSYLEAGNRLFQEGKYPDAALNYQKALQRDAKFAEAHYRLGLVYLKQNKAREALDVLSQAVELAPSNDDAVGKLADLLLTIYLQDRSRPEFLYTRLNKLADQAFKQDARSFHGFRIRGFLKMTDGKPAEASEAFKDALRVRPEDPDVSLALIRPLLDLNQPAEAERVAKAAIEKHKDFGPLYDVLYLLYLTQNRAPDALQVLQTKISNNPTNTTFALQLCSYYFQNKKYPEMTAAIQRILSDPKNYPDGPLKVADFYASRHDWKEAAAQIDSGMRAHPDQKIAYQKLLINILIAQDKVDDAFALTETIIKADPKDTQALAVRGTLFMRKPDKLDAAQKDFQTLVELAPKDPVFRFKLGRVYQMKGDTAKAKVEYNESAKLRVSYLPPRMGLAEMSFQQRDYPATITHLKSVLAYDAKNPEVRIMLSAALMGLGDYDKARAELTDVLKDFPQYEPAEIQIAYVDLNQKRYREAETLFKKHYRPGVPDVRVLRGLVDVNVAEGHGAAALDLIRSDMKRSSETPAARELLAATAARIGQYNVAIEGFKQLLAAQPDSADLNSKLADAYRLSGDSANALVYFQKAADLAPKQLGPTLMVGTLLARAGRVQEAKARYQLALSLAPDNPLILNNLASLMADTGGDFNEGMKHARRALEKDPDNPHMKDTIGWLYARMNNHDAAIQILDNLTRKYPKEPVYRYHLGYAMLQKGQKDQARNQLNLALSNTPAKEDEEAIKKLLASIGSS